MLRSLSYVADTGLRTATAGDRTALGQLTSWARGWETCMSASFLDGYLEAADTAIFMPVSADQFRRSLELLVLDKALHELQYDLNNRPHWAAIPLRGVMQILQSGAA
jgi:maltose alpha-D-glucosyltransferase/alpha-amylase